MSNAPKKRGRQRRGDNLNSPKKRGRQKETISARVTQLETPQTMTRSEAEEILGRTRDSNVRSRILRKFPQLKTTVAGRR